MRRMMMSVCLFSAMSGLAQSPDDERAIIQQSLEKLLAKARPDIRSVVLTARKTTVDLAAEHSAIAAADGLVEAWRDYEIQNHTSIPISQFDFPKSVTTAELEPLKTEPRYDWAAINTVFPNTAYVVEVSRPGFQNDGRTAVIRYDLVGRNSATTPFVAIWQLTASGWKSVSNYFPVGRGTPPTLRCSRQEPRHKHGGC